MNKIFRSYSILLLITLLIRFLDVAKNLFVASQIGVSANSDIYLSLISIPDSILVIVGLDSIRGVLNSEYSAIYSKNEKHLIINSISNLLKIIFWISLFLVTIMVLLRTSLIDLLLPGFTESKKIISYQIAFFIFPIFLFKALSSIVHSVFNSIKKFYFPAIIQVVISVCVIISIFLPYVNQNIIFNLSIAFFIGNTIVFLLLLYRLVREFKISFNIFRIEFDSVSLKILKSSLSIFILAVFNQLYLLSKNYFVSFFPDGSVSAVNYASSAGQFISMLTFNVVFSILVSDLSSIFTTDKLVNAKKVLFKTFNYLAYLYIPIIVIFICFNNEILQLLYLRGNFNQSGIDAIRIPFYWEALNLYPFLLYIIPTALFLAKKKYTILTYAGSISFLIGIGLNFLGVTFIGYYGVTVAMVGVSIIYGSILLYYSHFIFGRILPDLKKYFLFLIIGIFTFGIIFGITNIVQLEFTGTLFLLLKLLIGSICVFLVYFCFSYLFRIDYPYSLFFIFKNKLLKILKFN